MFTGHEYSDVAIKDALWVMQEATNEYALFLFKNQNINNTDKIELYWTGKSDNLTNTKSVYLQIYNQTGGTWEVLDQVDNPPDNEDFDLYGVVSESLSQYYAIDNWVSWRVFQRAWPI
jgi:hypothetical protein